MTAALQPDPFAIDEEDGPVLMALAHFEPVRVVPSDVLLRLATTCRKCAMQAGMCACIVFEPAVKRLA